MNKEQELIQKIREDKELRDSLLQTDSPEEALKVVNGAGLEFTVDEFREMVREHAEMLMYYRKMSKKAGSVYKVSTNLKAAQSDGEITDDVRAFSWAAFDAAVASGPFE